MTRSYLNDLKTISPGHMDAYDRVLSHIRPNSPCGLIHSLCLKEGAEIERSNLMAISAELFYAACSLTDDIQDGESDYAGKTLAQQVNIQASIICAAFSIFGRMGLSSSIGDYGVAILDGQHIELSKTLDINLYAEYTLKIAGLPFGIYMAMVPTAKRDLKNVEHWYDYGKYLGKAIQICTDHETKDPRWHRLSKPERLNYFLEIETGFEKKSETLPNHTELVNLTKTTMGRLECVKSDLGYGDST